MSKFRKKSTQYHLTWSEGEYEGLEVTMKSIPIEKFLALTDMSVDAADNAKVQGKNTRQIFTTFSDALVEWNLADEDGNDVPATLEGVMSQELDFIFMLFGEWQKQIGGVSDDLGKGLTSGKRSLEESLTMEAL